MVAANPDRVIPRPGVRERVAVIGSGISGLAAAYLLSRAYEVTLFEARDRLGGHTHTARFDLDGRRYAVDTGFIVHNDWTYPNFIRLMERIGVRRRDSDMSFSVSCEQTGLEYNGTTLDTLFAQRTNLLRPRFHRMIRDILRFNREALELLEEGAESPTLGDYVRKRGYSQQFMDWYLMPMASAVWSTGLDGIRSFPAPALIRFFANHGMLSVDDRPMWKVLEGGSDVYLAPLTEPYADRCRTGTPIERIVRRPDFVEVLPAGGDPERFDHVVLATHSDQALRMLGDPSRRETEILGAIPYTPNETVLHRDPALLPRRRRAWAAWNYHLLARQPDTATVTYHMNKLQSLVAPHEFCVTLGRPDAMRPDSVLRRMTYHHPAFTHGSLSAQARRDEICGARRTWYCGAYWGYGFHEDGVNSALHVATGFGQEL